MREINVARNIAAGRSVVWAVLADFPNIAEWNGGVKKSFATLVEIGGVGATCHCDFSPVGELEETVVEWEPESKMVIRIDSAKKLPISAGVVTFTFEDGGTSTPSTVTYAYDTKWGPIGRLMGPMIDRQLTTGFGGFLVDLEKAAIAGG